MGIKERELKPKGKIMIYSNNGKLSSRQTVSSVTHKTIYYLYMEFNKNDAKRIHGIGLSYEPFFIVKEYPDLKYNIIQKTDESGNKILYVVDLVLCEISNKIAFGFNDLKINKETKELFARPIYKDGKTSSYYWQIGRDAENYRISAGTKTVTSMPSENLNNFYDLKSTFNEISENETESNVYPEKPVEILLVNTYTSTERFSNLYLNYKNIAIKCIYSDVKFMLNKKMVLISSQKTKDSEIKYDIYFSDGSKYKSHNKIIQCIETPEFINVTFKTNNGKILQEKITEQCLTESVKRKVFVLRQKNKNPTR